MEFHGAAIGAIFEKLAKNGDAGRLLIDDLASDQLVSSLLLLYGLHPVDLETRVKRGLEKVKPYLHSHGGNIELLDISTDGVVRVSLQGSCHSCPSSAVTMKTSVEQAIYEAAPDVSGIEVDGIEPEPTAPPSGFVPVEMLIHSAGKAHLQGATS
jgi:Fe-S cluster biogenesis protein NfuA